MRALSAASHRRLIERAALSAGLLTLFIGGYFSIGIAGPRSRVFDVATPLDAQIPFVAGTIWIYLCVFPMALLPLFVVRGDALFRRAAAAYAAAMVVAYALFMLIPVTSAPLRAPPAMLHVERISDWMVARVYAWDPPYNLFPSLHLAIAWLAARAAWSESRACGAAAFALVAVIAVSTCAVKQHFALDVVAGLMLGAAVGSATIGRCSTYHLRVAPHG